MKNKSIVILTGAGISQESGIKTFRDSNGLWENHSLDEVATPEGFSNNPELVYEFYNTRREQLLSDSVKANLAHSALEELEQKWPGDFLLVTQNIDDLHERAGSKKILHMHGELLKMRCLSSGKGFSINSKLTAHNRCTCCAKPNKLRPDIVWFGEMPFHMEEIQKALYNCDYFLSIGTSGQVYPAAGFVQMTKSDCMKIEINLDPTDVSCSFDKKIIGLATEKVPEVIKSLLSSM